MQSVFSAVFPESGKTRRVSHESIHVISACNCFVVLFFVQSWPMYVRNVLC